MERHNPRPRSARSSSPPPNTISRDTYYAQWPYYNPPGGWVYRPDNDTDESWRSFSLPGLAEPLNERSAFALAHPYGFFPHWSPDRGVYIEGGNPDAFPGSPFLARATTRTRSSAARRSAAHASFSLRPHAPTHPLRACVPCVLDGPELLWDLTENLHTEAIFCAPWAHQDEFSSTNSFPQLTIELCTVSAHLLRASDHLLLIGEKLL